MTRVKGLRERGIAVGEGGVRAQVLGTVGDTLFQVAVGPGSAGVRVDAYVVPLRDGRPGDFGRRLRSVFPNASWDQSFGRVRVLRPAAMAGGPAASSPYIYFVTLRDPGERGGDRALENVVPAVREVLRVAGTAGCRSIAVPVDWEALAGLPVEPAASLVPALRAAAEQAEIPERVVLVMRSGIEEQMVRDAWGEPEQRREVQLSPGARSLLEEARRATGVAGPLRILRVFLEREPAGADGFDVVLASLVRHRMPDVADGLRRLGRLAQREGAEAPYRTAELLVTAERLAVAEGVSDQVHRRHLLMVLLSPPLGDDVPGALGLSAADLTDCLAEALSLASRQRSAGDWRLWLNDTLGHRSDDPEPPGRARVLAGGFSSDLVDPRVGIPLSQDHLGRGVYAEMLATLIADRKTPTPLSVGLFGPWGSGKSTFMGLLRRQIDDRSALGGTYLPNVVQIGFNAWTYADTNLWASLGDEIFRRLADIDGRERARQEELTRVLRRELDSSGERTGELTRAQEAAARRTRELLEELDRLRGVRRGLLEALVRATDAELAGDWKRLGVQDQGEQVQVVAEQLRGTVSGAITLYRTLQGRRGWALGAVLTASAVVLLVGLVSAGAVQEWSRFVGLAGLLAGAATVVRWLAGARAAMARVTRVVRQFDEARDPVTQERIEEALAGIHAAQARERALRAQYDEELARAGELRRELEELSPGRRLYAFLAERAGSDDYRGSLGLISVIRRDLEKLSGLMSAWPQEHGGQERPIDRIVLYIDDLDRCAPAQVVAVLEAVHLLLALDLFVVVLGVDPQWLVRSLRTGHRALLGDQAPDDYLKKIFNIPFVLPAVAPEGFRAMIEHLSGPSAVPGAVTVEAGEDPAPLADEGAGPLVQAGSAASRVRRRERVDPEPLGVEEREVLSAQAPLVRQPREIKRLHNLYRMLRSTQDLSPASSFIGGPGEPGQFRAVAVLLGLLSAAPEHLHALLFAPPGPQRRGGICRRAPGPESWEETLAGLEPRRVDGTWVNDVAAGLDAGACRDWADLVRAARQVPGPVELAAFRIWGPHIARFTFGPSEGPVFTRPGAETSA
ncbi:P-loop NTPase fold protein [Kineosporia succinea]